MKTDNKVNDKLNKIPHRYFKVGRGPKNSKSRVTSVMIGGIWLDGDFHPSDEEIPFIAGRFFGQFLQDEGIICSEESCNHPIIAGIRDIPENDEHLIWTNRKETVS